MGPPLRFEHERVSSRLTAAHDFKGSSRVGHASRSTISRAASRVTAPGRISQRSPEWRMASRTSTRCASPARTSRARIVTSRSRSFRSWPPTRPSRWSTCANRRDRFHRSRQERAAAGLSAAASAVLASAPFAPSPPSLARYRRGARSLDSRQRLRKALVLGHSALDDPDHLGIDPRIQRR
jgi:hypothetical protein